MPDPTNVIPRPTGTGRSPGLIGPPPGGSREPPERWAAAPLSGWEDSPAPASWAEIHGSSPTEFPPAAGSPARRDAAPDTLPKPP